MNSRLAVALFIFCFSIIAIEGFAQQDITEITINATKTTGPYKPIWSYFGYDEANFTTMKDGKKLLTELAALSPSPVYVRMHNLLTSGDGKADLKWSSTNVYTEDAHGNPVYNWQIVDSIFDVLTKRGIRPIAEIGFMPEALSVMPQPYRHHWKPGLPYDSIYTGWAYPPKDYKKWAKLIYQWVKHCIKRYGEQEVKTWYWEVWNEPNIAYWKGTMEEYFTLYDYTADAVKRAFPSARVGGPTSTGPRWDKAADFLKSFLQHCVNGKNYATGKTGSPLDYITFHAKGNPSIVNNHVQMNMAVQLQDVAKGFEIISSFSSLKKSPIIIGEFDPEGCAACSVDYSPQNAYRNGTMYSSYTAASFAQLYAMKKKYDVNLTGAVSWSFEFENQPWFAGFRDLATNGVDKPVLNVFRMFGRMRGDMLEVNNSNTISLQTIIDSSVRNKHYVDGLATIDAHNMYIMLWNYHDDDNKKTDASINLVLQQLPSESVMINSYLVDENHSNSYTVWKKFGSPQQVSEEQFHDLQKAGKLQKEINGKQINATNGNLNYHLNLEAQGVTLLKLSW
ncbi:MAG TPA: beta-xylosidase [Chitinophagaceae bacterium]|nr:beta-xylosidase [Chitinophagaceae bacterium]